MYGTREQLVLLDKIEAKKAEVRKLVAEGKTDEAKAAKAEMVDMQQRLDLLDGTGADPVIDPKNMQKPMGAKNDEVKDFCNAARRRFADASMLKEGSDPDGGYTVPEDVRTKIEQYRTAEFSLSDLVTVETTKFDAGQRTYQDKSDVDGFEEVGEGEAINQTKAPTFSRISYAIKKFGGFLPVTNELLSDSDARIVDVISRWMGRNSRATRNKKILAALTTAKNSKYETIEDLDSITKIVDITLGSVYAGTSTIITNDYGKYEMSKWKDGNGRSLLQPMPNETAKYQLAFGSVILPVRVLPTKDFPNVVDGGHTYAPIILGDIKEACVLFDRQKLSLMDSNTASIANLSAFGNDLTIYRGLERFDVKVKDADAYVMAHFGDEIVSSAVAA